MNNRNFVAKHAATYNKSAVMKDRKKAAKRGDSKHKGKRFDTIKYSLSF